MTGSIILRNAELSMRICREIRIKYSGRRMSVMAQTTVSVRMDDALKKEFDNVCTDLGLSMTTAITMLAKKMTREKRLPF